MNRITSYQQEISDMYNNNSTAEGSGNPRLLSQTMPKEYMSILNEQFQFNNFEQIPNFNGDMTNMSVELNLEGIPTLTSSQNIATLGTLSSSSPSFSSPVSTNSSASVNLSFHSNEMSDYGLYSLETVNESTGVPWFRSDRSANGQKLRDIFETERASVAARQDDMRKAPGQTVSPFFSSAAQGSYLTPSPSSKQFLLLSQAAPDKDDINQNDQDGQIYDPFDLSLHGVRAHANNKLYHESYQENARSDNERKLTLQMRRLRKEKAKGPLTLGSSSIAEWNGGRGLHSPTYRIGKSPTTKGGEGAQKGETIELKMPAFAKGHKGAGSFGFINLRKPGAWTRLKTTNSPTTEQDVAKQSKTNELNDINAMDNKSDRSEEVYTDDDYDEDDTMTVASEKNTRYDQIR